MANKAKRKTPRKSQPSAVDVARRYELQEQRRAARDQRELVRLTNQMRRDYGHWLVALRDLWSDLNEQFGEPRIDDQPAAAVNE